MKSQHCVEPEKPYNSNDAGGYSRIKFRSNQIQALQPLGGIFGLDQYIRQTVDHTSTVFPEDVAPSGASHLVTYSALIVVS